MGEEGYWNYRVIKRRIEDGSEDCYQIHEVYYDYEGKIETWTCEPVEPSGESLDELRADCSRFSKALQKPVLVEAQSDGLDILIEDEMKCSLNTEHYREIKRNMDFPKLTIPHLPEKLSIDGYELRLTCNIAPEQYDVFKEQKLVGYVRCRHDMLQACCSDVDGDVVYESCVDEGDREKVSECLAEAIRAIDAKVVSDA